MIRNRVIIVMLLVICICVICFASAELITYEHESKVAEEKVEILRPVKPEEAFVSEYDLIKDKYEDIYNQNNDFAAWLRISGTAIDYPVMQTPADMQYYLHRDFEKNYSAAGTLFFSDYCNIEKPDDVILIYGHFMKNKTMFGSLGEYSKKEYLDGHRIIQLDTLTGRMYYEIISVIITEVETELDSEFKYYEYHNFASEDEFKQFLREIKNKELYETDASVMSGDKFILLSTCNYSSQNARLVVVAKLLQNI